MISSKLDDEFLTLIRKSGSFSRSFNAVYLGDIFDRKLMFVSLDKTDLMFEIESSIGCP